MNDTALDERPTIGQLQRKLELLQRSHDRIEREGFTIEFYVAQDFDDDGYRPSCYIGAVRRSAGVLPTPLQGTKGRADLGDGPELALALEELDERARIAEEIDDVDLMPYLRDLHVNDTDEEIRELISLPGRFVESFGLWLSESMKLPPERQREVALRLFREAIRSTIKQIENAGGEPLGEIPAVTASADGPIHLG